MSGIISSALALFGPFCIIVNKLDHLHTISMRAVSIITMILVVSFITLDVSFSQEWEENKDPATGEKYYVASTSSSKQDSKAFSYNLVAFVSKEEKSLGFSTTFSSKIDPVREGQDTVLIEFTMSDKSVIHVNGTAGKFELEVNQHDTYWEQTYFVPVNPSLDMKNSKRNNRGHEYEQCPLLKD